MDNGVPDQRRDDPVVVVVCEEVAEANRIDPRSVRRYGGEVDLGCEITKRFANRYESALAGVTGAGVSYVALQIETDCPFGDQGDMPPRCGNDDSGGIAGRQASEHRHEIVLDALSEFSGHAETLPRGEVDAAT